MAKKPMGLHWCMRCWKDVQTHDGGGYLYGIWMTVRTCNECGYAVSDYIGPVLP